MYIVKTIPRRGHQEEILDAKKYSKTDIYLLKKRREKRKKVTKGN